jgi:hypothetical protein
MVKSASFFQGRRLFASVAATLVTLTSTATPGSAAETFSFWYGSIQRSVGIADLRRYAETQDVSPDLAGLFRFFNDSQQQQFQKALSTKLPIDVVTVSELLDSELGKALVKQVAPVFIRQDQTGETALRAALVLAATSKDGFGIVSFLEAYPSSELSLDVKQVRRLLKDNEDITKLVQQVLKPRQ